MHHVKGIQDALCFEWSPFKNYLIDIILLSRFTSGSALLPHCLECIIGVHDAVDQVVHGDEPPCRRGVLREGVPAVQQHCNVVVPA